MIRPDMEDLAEDLGCSEAMELLRRTVVVPEDIWADYEALAKRTHCKTETAIIAALSEWLGRV